MTRGPVPKTWWIAAQGNLASLRAAIPFHRRGHVRHDVLRDDGARRAVAEIEADLRKVTNHDRPTSEGDAHGGY